jgi:hypothetical protein
MAAKPLIRIRFHAKKGRSERCSAPRPGSAPPATENTRIPHPKPPSRRPSRHCSWARWSRLSHLAFGPHPSTTDPKLLLRIRSPAQKNVRRDVRRSTRRDRRFRYLFNDRAAPGSATPATENPNPKPPSRRPSRHCSWVRWPRLSHLAPRPHLSKHGSETAGTNLLLGSFPGRTRRYRHRKRQDTHF